MNTRSILILNACFILLTICALGCKENKSKFPIDKLTSKFAPADDYFMMKYGNDGKFSLKSFERSVEEARTFGSQEGSRVAGNWQVEGPGNIGGRVNTIAIHPTNPNIQFLGFSKGGLFKTKDGGSTWKPVFDDKIHLNIGDITFDPANPNIMYAGSGDPNIGAYVAVGDGLYKSTDGGENWIKSGLESARIISEVHVSAQNSQTIYAATMGLPFEKNSDRGLYKSTNGGTSWSKILYINDSTGIIDIAVNPTNDQVIYAASWNRIRNNKKSLVSGPDANIYRSLNGGVTWDRLSGGLPSSEPFSRIGIEISQSNPNVLYASYVDPVSLNISKFFKTSDAGLNWTSLAIDDDMISLPTDVAGGFGWYFGKIAINPLDENDVFVLGVDLWRSKDGGNVWSLATPKWWTYEVHADKHDLVFDRNLKMYLGTDGGAYSSSDDGFTWQDIENIPTNQIYRVAHNPHNPDLYYGGLQDNGTTGGNISKINEWERIYGGDGFQAIFDPADPSIFYVETQNGSLSYTDNGGEFFQEFDLGIESSEPRNWDMPFVMSPQSSKILFTGTDRVYINKDAPLGFWEPISQKLTNPSSDYLRKNISAIGVDQDDNRIIAGTSDAKVWITTDRGNSWRDITNGLPDRYVTSVSFSRTFPNRIYVGLSGYRDNDQTPLIYASDDLGTSWKSIGNSLPTVAINKVLVLPSLTDVLYDHIFVGTDAGVFYRNAVSNTWSKVGDNMVSIPVYDLTYNDVKNQLVAGTFGRGIQTFDLDQIGYTVSNREEKILPLSLKTTIVKDQLTIMNDEDIKGELHYEVYRIDGQICSRGKINANDGSNKIDVNSLITGAYFIKIHSRDRTKSMKFLKM
jgi:photosystem II stability/assembly factor-like uncharacterized protein